MFNFNAKCKELKSYFGYFVNHPASFFVNHSVCSVCNTSAVSECVMGVFGTRIIIFFSVYIYTVYRGGVWIEVDKGYICPLLYEENKRCVDVTVYLL